MEPIKLPCASAEDEFLEVKTFASFGGLKLQLRMDAPRTHPWINFTQESAKGLKKFVDEFIETGRITGKLNTIPSTIGKGYAF